MAGPQVAPEAAQVEPSAETVLHLVVGILRVTLSTMRPRARRAYLQKHRDLFEFAARKGFAVGIRSLPKDRHEAEIAREGLALWNEIEDDLTAHPL